MFKEPSGNNSTEIIFTVQCFTDIKELQIHIFSVFLIILLIILTGNITIIATITIWPLLHTPMYMFLVSLSFLDIFYTLTTLPKLLRMVATQDKTISFAGCMIQLYVFMALTCIEFILLAVMAYDRYVAICHPLHYGLLMSHKLCLKLIISVWIAGFLDTATHAFLISNLSFCLSRHIDHFFCDVTPVLKITCSDTSTFETLTYINGAIVAVPPFTVTALSYIFIICTILKIQSSKGRKKAFSTCASHLTCVVILYGTLSCSYMRPTKTYNPKQETFFALLYIVLVPMLNPVIYTLRNKEFKGVLSKIIKKAATAKYIIYIDP
ncbi:olfactory receptor 1F1 [Xenopus laevis]|uniref:Olfactory receptor n=1 Tax=Xenopus laevis TaxID=8355 RepID=A0A8J0T9Q9_XENLA|nr:olfactory receptor 1F1 [Xenopus laevis]